MASIYNIRINLDTSDVSGKAGKAKQGISEIGQEAERTNKILGQMRTFVAGYFTFTGISAIAKNLKQTADAYTDLTNKIKTVSSETENLSLVTQQLFDIAQKSRTEISGTAQLYQRLKIAQKSLGATSEELMKFTEGIGKAMVISGASVGTQRAVLLQLSQAMGQTNLRAEEFNSIQEGGLYILQAAANGMIRFNGNINALRQAVLAGTVTNKEFFAGVLNGLSQINKDFSKTTPTIEQSLVVLNNAWIKLVGNFNSATGISQDLAKALKFLADNLNQVAEYSITVGSSIAGSILILKSFSLAAAGASAATAAFVGSLGTILAIPAFYNLGASIGEFVASLQSGEKTVNSTLKEQTTTLKLISDELYSQKILSSEVLDKYRDMATEGKISEVASQMEQVKEKITELKNNISKTRFWESSKEDESAVAKLKADLLELSKQYILLVGIRDKVKSDTSKGNYSDNPIKVSEDAAKKAADSIKDLTFELSLFGKTEREIAQAKAAQKALGASPEDINRIKELTGKVYDLTKQEELLKKVKEDIKTPQEKYKDQLKEIDDLYKLNRLSVDDYTKAVAKLNEEFANDNMPKWQQALRDLYRETDLLDTKTMSFTESGKEALADWVKTGFGTLEDTITNIATNGTTSLAQSFSDMTVSILSDLTRIVIRATIVNNALTALGVGSSGLTGGGLLSFFGFGSSASSSGASTVGGSSLVAGGGASYGAYATGGYVSGPGTATSDSIPAWLSNGEFVMSASATRRYLPMLERMNNKYASGGLVGGSTSGGTTLIVNDNRNASEPPVQMERSMDANGNETIRMYINQEIKRSASNGTLDRALATNYGLKRAGIRR